MLITSFDTIDFNFIHNICFALRLKSYVCMYANLWKEECVLTFSFRAMTYFVGSYSLCLRLRLNSNVCMYAIFQKMEWVVTYLFRAGYGEETNSSHAGV